MDELLDFATFDPDRERDLFGPLADFQRVKVGQGRMLDKRAAKPTAPGLGPSLPLVPRAA